MVSRFRCKDLVFQRPVLYKMTIATSVWLITDYKCRCRIFTVPQPVSENVEPCSSKMTTDVQEKHNTEIQRYEKQQSLNINNTCIKYLLVFY